MPRDPYQRLHYHTQRAIAAAHEILRDRPMTGHGFSWGRGFPEQYAAERAKDARHLQLVKALTNSADDAEDLAALLGEDTDIDFDAADSTVADARKKLKAGSINLDQFKQAIHRALPPIPKLDDAGISELAERLARDKRLTVADALVQQLRLADELGSPETEKAAWDARSGRVAYSRDCGELAPRDVPASDLHHRAASRLRSRCPHLDYQECLRRVLNR